jgi:hypothetical protein
MLTALGACSIPQPPKLANKYGDHCFVNLVQTAAECRAYLQAMEIKQDQERASQQAAEAERQRALAPAKENLQRAYRTQLEEAKRRIWATYSDIYAQMHFFEVLNRETTRLSNEMEGCLAAAAGMYRGPAPDAQTCVDVYSWKLDSVTRAYQN